MRSHSRDRSGAELLRLVPPQEKCFFCGAGLVICETQQRYIQTLTNLLHVIGKGKKCASGACAHGALRYRSPEVGRLVLKAHEFGRDIVLWAGDQHVRENVSIARIHRRLVGDFTVPICERSVGNLVNDYLALCQCVAGDSGRVRARLKHQGGIVLCVDGVHFDEASPVLYVQRDAISGEVLYAERHLAQGKADLVPMLRRSAELAAELEVPILGIASDKERSLVPAIAEVFPGVPHQFCQTHFLKNVAEPLKEDDQELARAAKESVLALRQVQRTIARRFPALAAGGGTVEGKPAVKPVRESGGGESAAPAMPATEAGVGDGAGEAKPAPEVRGSGTAGPGSALDHTALAEARVAAALARAGATAGMVCGRPITDPSGLKRLQRLGQVRAAVEQAARKRGLQKPAGP